MHLTVCGSSPAWADPGGACSGYLVRETGTTLLIDCGNGVLAKAREICDLAEIDGVLLTHMHGDHVADLLCLAYAVSWDGPPRDPVTVWGPEEMPDRLRSLASASGADPSLFERAFELRTYEVESLATWPPRFTRISLGSLELSLVGVPHSLPTVAVDVQGERSARFTLSADCGPSEHLPAIASRTPLLLCEATLQEASDTHLCGAWAGRLAATAGAKRLMLTHYYGELRAQALNAAARTFGGRVEAASAGTQLEL
jgi:ribonuclease BN (tRNA processing enzyme)